MVKFMSLIHNGESCSYCKAKLFSDDDVVYCPVCGAPHHRECYNSIGHCALEQLHGTENEYSKENELEKLQKIEEEKKRKETERLIEDSAAQNTEPETTRCKMCGEEYPFKNASCPKCGAPNFVRINGTAFDFLGGVPAEHLIDDGITAEDARKFVISNTHRYIPKFVQLKKKKKTSWNWMAFLFPSCWALSRKLYTVGILTGILLIISTLLAYPFYSDLVFGGVYESGISSTELINRFNESFNLPAFLAACVSLVINLATRIITALFGDWWYKKYTVESIRKIRSESHDVEMDYRKKGGVNLFLFLLSYLILNYLPSILLSLI